ncbi:hypothetical protein [Oerskovia paurometabola]|uniref:hypothetical protein n=1 Tax=Oerskovia paurometabola TaxID=162170 RepID=UPI0034381821
MTQPTCEKCGQPHPGCTGHTKNGPRAGLPCARPCLPRETCNSHGGAAPQVRAARLRRAQEAEAARQVATLGLAVDITPTDALLQEVQWTAGHVQWLRTKVQELDEQALVWGTTAESEKESDKNGRETSFTVSAKPSVWYSLYQAERAHLVAVCTAALKAGVEERKVRLAEQQGDLVVAVIRRILDGLYAALLAAGLTADQLTDAWQTAVADVVPRELRAIANGA